RVAKCDDAVRLGLDVDVAVPGHREESHLAEVVGHHHGPEAGGELDRAVVGVRRGERSVARGGEQQGGGEGGGQGQSRHVGGASIVRGKTSIPVSRRPAREAYRARAMAGTILLLLGGVAAAAAGRRGTVKDREGTPVAGAEVAVRAGDHVLPAVATASDGSFAFDPGDAREAEIVVRAPGYVTVTCRVSAEEEPAIVLERGRRREEVTATAARGETRLGDPAARVVVLGPDDLSATAAPTLDDALRQVPGFSLFRRSDSRVANPTSQGASLRGVGPSGTSRALVLLDGVPLNDAFGGWVYWSRVPAASLERVEVLEGGASDLYGSAALGGVVQARD